MTDAAWGGTDAAPEAWSHGPWRLQRQGDELADLAFAGRTVLRSIRAVVRDRDWRTVPPEVTGIAGTDGALRLALRFAGLGAELDGELEVRAAPGALTASMTLTSRTDFLRNRIGLVVLHAAEVAGSPLAVGHPDGTIDAALFPERIAPHQPAMAVASLGWTTRGVACRLAFDGDVFEMEDQRNWTDASFKTYSTPLAEPFPVLVRAGDVIRQEVVLGCALVGADDPAPEAGIVELVPRGDRLPELLLGATTESGALPRAISPTVLVELDADGPDWREALERAATEAGSLDVRIVTDRADTVREVVAALPSRVVRIGVLSPVDHVTHPEAWAALRDADLEAAPVGGTRAHFTELNRRHRDLPDDLPALTFSSTPEMHAVETRQLLESIDVQRLTAEDAVRIAAGRPVHVGPVTLRARFNAVATEAGPPLQGVAPGHAPLDPAATDPRQTAPALAAWLVASAAAFAVPGVASIAWFEASGPRGVLGNPVETAFRDLLDLAGTEALDAVGAPRGVHVIAGGDVALVANLRDTAITVTLRRAGAERALALPPQTYRRVVLPG